MLRRSGCVQIFLKIQYCNVPCFLDMYVCIYGNTFSKSMDQLGKVAIPTRGQLNRENEYFPVPVRA